jgi:hypothetical protein
LLSLPAARRSTQRLARGSISLEAMLHRLDRDELEQLCRAHDLDASARNKDELIARILPPAEAPPLSSISSPP